MRRRSRPRPMLGELVLPGSGEGRGLRIELGRDAGALSISVGESDGPTKERWRYVQLYIRWEGRPEGGQLLHEDYGPLPPDYEYVTHALLDLTTGEIIPHYQA